MDIGFYTYNINK